MTIDPVFERTIVPRVDCSTMYYKTVNFIFEIPIEITGKGDAPEKAPEKGTTEKGGKGTEVVKRYTSCTQL
jgi:hypothetical protein